MTSFKAFETSEKEGKVFVSEIVDKTIDQLPENEVLIRVSYSSLNYKDALSATGNKGITKNYPHTSGIDAAGEVVQDSTGSFSKDEKVIVTGYDLGMNTPGGYGQYIRVPAAWVVRCPKNLSLKESMIFGTAGLTAAMSIDKLLSNGLQPSQGPVVVSGATGGVGSVAVAILVKLGFEVVGISGKLNAKAFLVDQLGAKEVIDRKTFLAHNERPLSKTIYAGGVDTVGGDILAAILKSTKYNGSVSCCGLVASTELNINVFPFILRGVNLLGVDSVEAARPYKRTLWEKLAGDWKIEALISAANSCKLEELNNRIDAILKGQLMGRTLVELN